MASNTVVAGVVGRFLREEFSGISRHMIEQAADPITRRIILNTAAVTTSANLGRPPAGTKTSTSPFEAMHPVSFGRSGTIKYQGMGTLLGNDSPPMLAKSVSFPAATDVPQRVSEWLTVGLKWITGNLTLDLQQWLALTSGNPVEDFLAKWLTDPYAIILQQLTSDFCGGGYGAVGQVATGGGATINAGAAGNIVLKGTVRKFWRGQRITVWDDNSGVPHSTQVGTGVTFVVTKVHNFTTSPTITLWNTHASTNVTIGNDDWLVLDGAWDGTNQYATLGMDYFTNPSATIHGLSKSDYPELLSYRDVPATNRNPEPRVFQRAVDAVADRGFKSPDLWLTTRGVRSLYYQQEALFKTYNTELSNPVQRGADGGMTGSMQFTTEERVVPIEISSFVPKGSAYLVRLDSLVRYAPKGTQAVQFLGENPLLGGGMFLPSINGSTGTYGTVFEAPFSFWYEMGCVEPQCLGQIGALNELTDVM